ncbi:mechanosensitive ion channel protein [Candidimonas nitroreducens]|uniref:Mechanosensitive ion channel protein n=2 Tax=Candidimonas nitroreducens TaxID=683354 RepID=A0A225N1Z5_9BURK|nr:mechanosensitive ion channel protein [Candidimonas nitroreducens]
MDSVQNSLKQPLDDAQLVQLRATVQDAQAQAKQAATQIEPQLTSVKARQAELGSVPAGTQEAPDVAAQRAQLGKSSSTLDSQLKLARLITVEGDQAVEQIQTLRRSQFQARLGARTDSVFGVPFWAELAQEWPRDAHRRFVPLGNELAGYVRAAPARVWVLVLLGVALLLVLRVLAGRALMRFSTTHVPSGRLRRSLYAVVRVVMAVAVPGLIATALHTGIDWSAALPDGLDALLSWLVGLLCFGGLVAGLGRALLAADRPSWRLPHLSDGVAQGLRRFPLLLSVVIVLGWAAQHLAAQVNASLSTTVFLDCLTGLLTTAILAAGLLRARRLRQATADTSDKGPAPALPIWASALMAAAWTALAISAVCLVAGYVAFGGFLARQVVWVVTVLGVAYLLSVLVEDGCASLLAAVKRGAPDGPDPGPMLRARCQALVLAAGLVRLAIVLITLMLLLIPFGEGPSEWISRFNQLYTGISIGEAQIRPTSVFLAALVLILGFACIRVLQRWLLARYLPATSLDRGMQYSAATLFGYAGYVLIVALALSAAGIGLERVAWIASALSVGIGFGLQAVVQNFVSGLILLAERPVKVGDWVTLGGVEGDIRRINVRATEIQMSDRSTVVVPNSEFITKIVRNVTHANPLGRVLIKLPMPLSTDADRARGLMLDALREHNGVLDEPAPSVLLEGLDAGGLVFNLIGYVVSPRAASGVRSDLLFDVLRRLREAGLPLSTPSTMLLAEAKPAGPVLPPTSAAAPGSASVAE